MIINFFYSRIGSLLIDVLIEYFSEKFHVYAFFFGYFSFISIYVGSFDSIWIIKHGNAHAILQPKQFALSIIAKIVPIRVKNQATKCSPAVRQDTFIL